MTTPTADEVARAIEWARIERGFWMRDGEVGGHKHLGVLIAVAEAAKGADAKDGEYERGLEDAAQIAEGYDTLEAVYIAKDIRTRGLGFVLIHRAAKESP